MTDAVSSSPQRLFGIVPARTGRSAVEWPTVGLAVVIFGGFLALTLAYAMLPTLAVVPAAAWLIAWHSSL